MAGSLSTLEDTWRSLCDTVRLAVVPLGSTIVTTGGSKYDEGGQDGEYGRYEPLGSESRQQGDLYGDHYLPYAPHDPSALANDDYHYRHYHHNHSPLPSAADPAPSTTGQWYNTDHTLNGPLPQPGPTAAGTPASSDAAVVIPSSSAAATTATPAPGGEGGGGEDGEDGGGGGGGSSVVSSALAVGSACLGGALSAVAAFTLSPGLAVGLGAGLLLAGILATTAIPDEQEEGGESVATYFLAGRESWLSWIAVGETSGVVDAGGSMVTAGGSSNAILVTAEGQGDLEEERKERKGGGPGEALLGGSQRRQATPLESNGTLPLWMESWMY